MRLFPLLLSCLLAAPAAWAQTDRLGGRAPIQPFPSQSLSQPPMRAPVWTTVAPTIPMNDGVADGLLAAEPDSARRRQYARARVRSGLKVRLADSGESRDTVDYQLIDAQGRCVQSGPAPVRPRRQWTYDAQGRCIALLGLPDATQDYTVISSYSPALRRSRQEVLQRSGERTVVLEKQLYQSADTLLTEVVARPLTLGHTIYPEYFQRSLRRAVHPDTVLTLTSFYNTRRELTGSRADYSLYRRGRLLESGRLDLTAARTGTSQAAAPDYARALAQLRHDVGRHPQLRRRYDGRQRLLEQQTQHDDSPATRTLESTTVIKYTYNSLDQLIGAEMTVSSVRTPARSSYIVFSYLPNGLLQGETTNARTSRAVLYLYQYQYYE